MSVTIKDVAKLAGVSASTVSLVINQKSNVRYKTRKRVEDAIAQLNFHPRRNARGLASRMTKNIGFVLTEDHFSRAEPFYTKVFLGTEFEARKHEYYILLTTVQAKFNPNEQFPRFLLEKNVDGVILAGTVPQKLIDYIDRLNLPVVLIDYLISSPKASTILTNNYHGGRIAVEHLIDYGHRQIGFVGGDINHPSIGDRLRGYRDALQAASIPADHALISTAEPSTAVDDGYNATRRLNQTGRGFTAIFAVNDIMAVGAMRCLHEAGRKVPEDVSIIGFDDIEVCLHVQPHLSTVRVFKEELGAIAVRRLVENIQTKRNMVSQVVVQVELVIRDSTRKLNP